MVVPVRAELLINVQGCGSRLAGSQLRFLARLRAEVRGLARGLPSADAVLALPRQRLDGAAARLPRALRANAHAHRVEFANAAARLSASTLRSRLHRLRDRCAGAARRLQPSARASLDRLARHLAGLQRILTALSYQGVLARGFALVRDGAGAPVRSAAAVAHNDPLEIEFADGRVPVVAAGGGAPRRRPPPEKGGQGSLF
jgi:exodeoxyribonuclease VII large subunit